MLSYPQPCQAKPKQHECSWFRYVINPNSTTNDSKTKFIIPRSTNDLIIRISTQSFAHRMNTYIARSSHRQKSLKNIFGHSRTIRRHKTIIPQVSTDHQRVTLFNTQRGSFIISKTDNQSNTEQCLPSIKVNSKAIKICRRNTCSLIRIKINRAKHAIDTRKQIKNNRIIISQIPTSSLIINNTSLSRSAQHQTYTNKQSFDQVHNSLQFPIISKTPTQCPKKNRPRFGIILIYKACSIPTIHIRIKSLDCTQKIGL